VESKQAANFAGARLSRSLWRSPTRSLHESRGRSKQAFGDRCSAEVGWRRRRGDWVYRVNADEVFLRDENKINLVWFVKIPATGKVYSCSYDEGFSQFRTGDDVRLIHPRDSSDANYGYVSGLRDGTSGKTAVVWVIDEDELELDVEPNN
jgi:hypothetical protein